MYELILKTDVVTIIRVVSKMSCVNSSRIFENDTNTAYNISTYAVMYIIIYYNETESKVSMFTKIYTLTVLIFII